MTAAAELARAVAPSPVLAASAAASPPPPAADNAVLLPDGLLLVGCGPCDTPASLSLSHVSRVALVRASFTPAGTSPPPLGSVLRVGSGGPPTAALLRADALQDPLRALFVDEYSAGVLTSSAVPLARFLTRRGLRLRLAADVSSPTTVLELPTTAKPQSSNHVLMIAPNAFKSNDQAAEDNAFMGTGGVDPRRVMSEVLREHAKLVDVLRRAGVEVHLFGHTAAHGTPDAVFPNNWFSTCSDALALYPVKCPNRRGERRPELVSFLKSRGYSRFLDLTSPESSTPPKALEGTGSLVLDHVLRVAYVARSERSDEGLAQRAASELSFTEVVAFDATDDAGTPIYHTNVLMAVGTGWAVVCSEAVEDAEQRGGLLASLSRGGREVVQISRAQMGAFAGNVLEVLDGDGCPCIAMSSAAFFAFAPDQRAVLLRHAAQLLHAPIPVIEAVGGGGVRCTIAELF